MSINEVLNSCQLYLNELNSYRLLSKEEQRELEEQARQGNKLARERIIIEGMHFVQRTAALYARTYLTYEDYLDLIQVGNLALVEHIDQTLARGKNIPYLLTIARNTIKYYSIYRSRAISLPMNQKLPQERPNILSMDALASSTDEKWMQLDNLIAQMQENTQHSEALSALRGPLWQALQSLSEKDREIVIRHHGIDGLTETIVDIAQQLPGKPTSNAVYVRYYNALKKLRKRLMEA